MVSVFFPDSSRFSIFAVCYTGCIKKSLQLGNSGVASSISEGDIFIYSCSAQLISFEIKSISKEVNCAEHKYLNMSPLTYRAGDVTVGKFLLNNW